MPSPRVIHDPAEMHAVVRSLQRRGRRVGLTPTMGALHAGHLSLVAEAHARADEVVATIFVNPTQFGPREDFSAYPRTLDDDLAALASVGCEWVFVPAAAAIYPSGFSTYVEPPAVANRWEGALRPGHFRGVATVVLQLLQIAPAEVVCFGQKDFQQTAVIRRMAVDFHLPHEIVVCPTIREADGLAMSSRNRYLSATERQRALGLWRALQAAVGLVQAGERSAEAINAEMRRLLLAAEVDQIDYAAVVEPDTLEPLVQVGGRCVALIAARLGATRLLDNHWLEC